MEPPLLSPCPNFHSNTGYLHLDCGVHCCCQPLGILKSSNEIYFDDSFYAFWHIQYPAAFHIRLSVYEDDSSDEDQ